MRTRHGSKRTKIEKESRVMLSETRRCSEILVPTDLVFEILRRLPAKTVARFLLVSKLWATIIRSREFIRWFPFRSSLKPHLVIAFKYLDNQNGRKIWNFFTYSSTSTKKPPLYLSFTTTCSAPSSIYRSINEVPYCVNGLISLGCGREQFICNPITGKSITLPKVRSRKSIIRSFFGYDPVNDQHKVLCMSEKAYDCWDGPSFEHQVFTLGGVDTSWRMIECNILHRPKTNGVCIDGVVYYGTWTGSMISEWCLVRFNVRSEKFDKVVPFLGDHSRPLSYRDPSLMTYKGKVTLVIETEQQRFVLWVLEDAEKHEWSKICFFINYPSIYSLGRHLRIISETSTTHTEEIVFVSHHLEDFYILYYNLGNNSLRTVRIQGNLYKGFGPIFVMIPLFSHVESVMLL